MPNEIRIACAVPAVQVCGCHKNVEDIYSFINKANEAKSDILIFPELALTGFTCADLFFQQTLIWGARDALQQIVSRSAQCPALYIALGAPLMLEGRLYNCGLLLHKGTVQGIVPKKDLPLAQKRWFSEPCCLPESMPSDELGLDESYSIPIGTDLLFPLEGGKHAALVLGEDGKLPAKADVVLHLSAAPAMAGGRQKRRQLAEKLSAGCVYGYVSAGSTESTQDQVFCGSSLVAAGGNVLQQNPEPVASDYMLLQQAQMASGSYFAPIRCNAPAVSPKQPFLPLNDPEGYALSVFCIQAAALARRLQTVGAKPVIGVSGGLDSTLALLVAVEAVRLLGRPSSDVIAITMPCFGTTERTHSNATALMDLLGVTSKQIHIQAAVQQHFADIGHTQDVCDTTYENAQARERTQVLMDYAGMTGGIVVGTGDLSELALGWCTYNGDHMSMYSVNGSVLKTLIPHVLRAAASLPRYRAAAQILEDVIATPISPELLPPDEAGRIAQQTEDLVGPYILHDYFLYYTLHDHLSPTEIYHMACGVFADEFDSATVKKWLKVFYKRFFTQQFKRSCMPEGVRVSDISLSPRGDWQMPSDACARLWLQETETL